MSKVFRLSLVRVQCHSEQFGEPGKDELYLVGFGITRSGQRIFVPPRSLGSFGSGDTSGPSGYPKVLIDAQVPDAESLVTTCIWLFERDRGDLASSGEFIRSNFDRALDHYLAANANLGLSPDARNMYAFAQTMLSMHHALQSAAYDLLNSDDVLQSFFKDHVPVERPRLGTPVYELPYGPPGYTLTFEYQLPQPELVVTQ